MKYKNPSTNTTNKIFRNETPLTIIPQNALHGIIILGGEMILNVPDIHYKQRKLIKQASITIET
jgi:hypothetical protein